MKLAPYPEYKDAGVSWIGRIPAHWPEKRAKYYFKEIDERSQTGDEEMLSVSHITGVTPRSQKNVTMFKAESNVGQKHCQPGDVVINTMWAWMSALGVSKHAGIVSPSYGVYRPRNLEDYDPYYLDHLLRIEGYRSEYICRSTGIRSSRLRLYPDKFLSMRVVCPPQGEQKAIARFLRAQDRLFRKFIRNKRRLIELLKEQKQNIINQAVTRGLDPNVKLKPSGVEWIGDVPEHWEVRRLKFLIKGMLQYGANEPSGRQDSGCPRYVRISDIKKNGELRKDTVCTIPKDIAEQYLLYEGDILFARSGATVGKTFCYQKSWGEAAYAGYLIRAKVDMQKVSHEFLFLFTRSLAYSNWIESSFIKATIQNISADKYASLWIPLPPRVEQESILGFIQQESEVINQTISRAEREIELMHEYRTRLISDVVTGKIDVRSIEVPEVAEEELLALDEGVHEIDKSIDDELEMEVEG